MKHAPLAPLLALLAACAAAPPPPTPTLVVPVAPAPPPAPEVASVELFEDRLVARDAAGKELFSTKKRFGSAVPAPGGGVVAASYSELSLLDEHGERRWKVDPNGGGSLVVGAGLVMVESGDKVSLFDLADGSPRGRVLVEDGALIREGSAPDPGFRVPLRLFPATPGQLPYRALAVSADGTILTGASDGSLLAFDAHGAPLFQTGVPGAVRSIDPLPGGDFQVRTSVGEVLVGPAGVKSEPPPPRSRPTLAFRVRPTPLRDKALGGQQPWSVVYVRPDDVWTMVSSEGKAAVRRYDGKSWRDVPTPGLHRLDERCWAAYTKEAQARCARAKDQDDVTANSLVRSSDGRILLLGVQRVPMRVGPAWASAELRVWESTGGPFRPHRELGSAVAKAHSAMGGAPGLPPLHAAGARGHEILCLNGDCLARGLSPSFHLGAGKAGPAPARAPPWTFFAWEGADWTRYVALGFAGATLWRMDDQGLTRDGKPALELSSDGYHALWAGGEDEVWALGGTFQQDGASKLVRWDGKSFTPVACPVPDAAFLWGTGPDDVWVSSNSAAAHFDGHAFSTLPGVSGRIVGIGREEAWIGGWHVSRDPAAQPDLVGSPAPLPPLAAPSRPLVVGPVDPAIRLDPAAVPGFRGALGLAQAPSGELWIHDAARVAETDGVTARPLHTAPGATPLRCGRCLAPTGAGSGLLLAPEGEGVVSLLPVLSGQAGSALTRSADLLAVARSSSGSVWIVAAPDDRSAPRALLHGPSGLRLLQGLPPAAYADVAPRTDDDAWLAGGLSRYHDGTRAWPEGEGLLVHFDGHAFTRHRAPDGALLAVVAVAHGEAWAVGVDGGLLHVRGDTAEAFHLVREDGSPLRHTLRAVSANGPDDVYFAGDASTLLHWDGRALRRADTLAVGPDAALSSLIAPGAKPGWLAAPSGVWRLSRGAPAVR